MDRLAAARQSTRSENAFHPDRRDDRSPIRDIRVIRGVAALTGLTLQRFTVARVTFRVTSREILRIIWQPKIGRAETYGSPR